MKDMTQAAQDALNEIAELAAFARTFCDSPDDRMYHAAEGSWWRREGNTWKPSEPPEGWSKGQTEGVRT